MFGCEAFTPFLVFSETQEGILGGKVGFWRALLSHGGKSAGERDLWGKHSLQGQLVPEEGRRAGWASSSAQDLLGMPCAPG